MHRNCAYDPDCKSLHKDVQMKKPKNSLKEVIKITKHRYLVEF